MSTGSALDESSSSPSIISSSSSSIISDSLNTIPNVSHQIHVKLTSLNYVLWKTQMLPLLRGYNLDRHINKSYVPPTPTLANSEPNPAYVVWFREDQIVMSWLNSSLSEALLSNSVGALSALEIWTRLEQSFAAGNAAQVRHLKHAIHHLERNTDSIEIYMQRAKNLSNQLLALNSPISNDDLVGAILDGLGPDYRPFVRSIEAKLQMPSYDELLGLLLTEELQQKKYENTGSPMTALFTTRTQQPTMGSYNSNSRGRRGGRGGRGGRNGGRFQNYQMSAVPSQYSSGPFLSSATCYNCNGSGHVARLCPSQRRTVLPSPQAYHTISAPVSSTPPWNSVSSSQGSQGFRPQQQPWIVDTGATHHLTGSLGNLTIDSEYTGPDEVTISNGNTIPITHVGSTMLHSNHDFRLSNILFSPHSPFSLLSVLNFTNDNQVSLEFFPDCFLIKDIPTRRVLHKSPVEQGLYKLTALSRPTAVVHHISFRSWHSRLGHAHDGAVLSTLKHNNIVFSSNKKELCSSCCVSKSQRLPFSLSSFNASAPLELICSDVWGPSPVPSINGNRYYVLFYDHFSKYTWLYCLKRKSDVLSTFIKFRKFVETFFGRQIKMFQCDWGGEFRSLATYLAANGISLRLSCPYTPQQNGCAERKHRHVVETGLAMLDFATLPLVYWDFAFETAAYVINRIVTPLIHKSPYEKLFGALPDLSSLRIFGCLCYPYLRPYNKHKLENRSSPCIFLGYSLVHKGYKCYDILAKRLYISRHVIFDETRFPFESLTVQVNNIPKSVQSSQGILGPPPIHLIPTISSQSAQNVPSTTEIVPTASGSDVELLPPPVSVLSETQVSPIVPSDRSGVVLPLPAPQGNTHPMLTRSKTGHSKPKVFLAVTPPLQPATVTEAKRYKEWREALANEINSLIQLGTWELVEKPPNANVIGCKWVFKIKENSDGSLDRYKARLVAKGFHQRPGVDFGETFSPVVKPVTVRLVLSLAVSQKWLVKQYDVSNAFLHGQLNEPVYMQQPPGFVDDTKPNHVCRLRRSLYGLKQAPRQWNNCLKEALLQFGFLQSKLDTSLFIFRRDSEVLYCLTYVDDLLITGTSEVLERELQRHLKLKFLLKDLGRLHYFLGIQAHWHNDSLLLTQQKYVLDLLKRVKMDNSKSLATPQATGSAVQRCSFEFDDPTLYRSTIGSLLYLLFTRPEISFTVNRLAQYMHRPTNEHWQEVKRVLRYLQGTTEYGLLLRPSTVCEINAYSDSDWAGSIEDRKSTTGFAIYLGRNLVSWASKKQRSVSRSSTEAEYRAIANTTSEVLWIRNLLQELGVQTRIPILWSDNLGATALTVNPVYHSRMKHVQIDVHFVRDKVQANEIQVRYISTKDQIADVLTKPLSKLRFQQLRAKLTIFPHR